MSATFTDRDWERLVQRINDQKCTPFLGAGTNYGTLPLGADIARAWASEHGYPLEDSYDLIRVSQFLAIKHDPMWPKEDIVRTFKKYAPPDFSEPGEPHRELARLPLPLYITTNYDDFMSQALRARKRDARQELCRWNRVVREVPSAFDEGFTPTVANPVVFHLHGHVPVSESLVLTEDDYMDFLVNVAADERLLPPPVSKALTATSLLFIGYKIADWNFRVLMRSVARFMESGLRRTHTAVMMLPEGGEAAREDLQNYLTKYYENIDVRVYWGTAREFLSELSRRVGGW